MKNLSHKLGSIAALLAAMVLLFSCTKDQTGVPNNDASLEAQQMMTPITNKKDQKQVQELIDKIPGIAVYNSTMDKYVLIDLNDRESKFNFASPNGQIVFASPSGSVTFVEGNNGVYYQVVGGGTSGGAGGGLITAGSIVLTVNYVVCFSSGDAEATDFFGFGNQFSGFAGAVGIAGDFEALASGEFSEDANPFDFLHGFVAFYVFDGSPDGEYEVFDFFDAQSGQPNLDGASLAYFISFQEDESAIFFGTEGNVIFDGNQVGFEGTYSGLWDAQIGFGGNSEEPEDANYTQAEGSGFLTCP